MCTFGSTLECTGARPAARAQSPPPSPPPVQPTAQPGFYVRRNVTLVGYSYASFGAQQRVAYAAGLGLALLISPADVSLLSVTSPPAPPAAGRRLQSAPPPPSLASGGPLVTVDTLIVAATQAEAIRIAALLDAMLAGLQALTALQVRSSHTGGNHTRCLMRPHFPRRPPPPRRRRARG